MGIDIKRKRELEEELCMTNAKKKDILSEDEKKEILAVVEADRKLKGKKGTKKGTIKEQLEDDLDKNLLG